MEKSKGAMVQASLQRRPSATALLPDAGNNAAKVGAFFTLFAPALSEFV